MGLLYAAENLDSRLRHAGMTAFVIVTFVMVTLLCGRVLGIHFTPHNVHNVTSHFVHNLLPFYFRLDVGYLNSASKR
jgi:hypothetical protein